MNTPTISFPTSQNSKTYQNWQGGFATFLINSNFSLLLIAKYLIFDSNTQVNFLFSTLIGFRIALFIFVFALISGVVSRSGGQKSDIVYLFLNFLYPFIILFAIGASYFISSESLELFSFIIFVIFWSLWVFPSGVLSVISLTKFPIPEIFARSYGLNFAIWQFIVVFDLVLLEILSFFDLFIAGILSIFAGIILIRSERKEREATVEKVKEDFKNKKDDEWVDLYQVENISRFRIASPKHITKLLDQINQSGDLRNKKVYCKFGKDFLQLGLQSVDSVKTSDRLDDEPVNRLWMTKPSMSSVTAFIVLITITVFILMIPPPNNLESWRWISHHIIFLILNFFALLISFNISFDVDEGEIY